MADIFISYKREEQVIAKKLAAALGKQNYTIWWDPELRAGESIDAAIEKELKNARCVIVLWSKLSIKSDYIKSEASFALKLKKLVPVKIEPVELPFRFEDVQAGNLTGWDGSDSFPEFRKLLKDLTVKMGIAKTAEKPKKDLLKNILPLPPPKLDSKRSVLTSTLTWTKIAEATEYILQNSKDPSFSQCVEVYKG